MAALSVQYLKSGIKKFQLFLIEISNNSDLKFEFAATPPDEFRGYTPGNNKYRPPLKPGWFGIPKIWF